MEHTKDEINNENIPEEVDIIDVLTDEDNSEPIYMYDENDNLIEFEQVAVIPLNENLYCILKPVSQMDDVAQDEALVFKVVVDEEGISSLELEYDEATAVEVFDSYYKLLDDYEKSEHDDDEDDDAADGDDGE